MRPIARIVIRGADENDGLIVGAALKGSRDVLKPGMVYELWEILGETVIKEIGKTCIGQTVHDPDCMYGACWGQDIGHLLRCAGKYLMVTQDEYKAICEQREKERDGN